MNKELEKLYEWLCINRLSLNISKTNFVIFCPPNKPKSPVTVKINKEAIDETQYVKYLGILIDSELSFKYHITELKKKISRAIGVLYRLRPFVNTKLLTSVYYAIIYPFLIYGVVIWGNAGITLLNPLLILQKKFVRMATFNDRLLSSIGQLVHTPPLFHKLKLLTIFDIFYLQLGIIIYQSINGLGPVNRVIKFTFALDIHNHETRYASEGNLYTDNVSTTRYGLKALQNEGKILWSLIPSEIRNRKTKGIFKSRLKELLIKTYII